MLRLARTHATTAAAITFVLVATLALTGCAAATPPTSDTITVVTTVAPITDLVARVGAGVVTVVGMVPDGVDSHTFEPTPAEARALSNAALFIANGLGLEDPAIRLAQANLPKGAPIVQLGDQTIDPDEWVYDRSFPRDAGLPNPHVWLDVTYAQRYVTAIAEALIGVVDPDHVATVRENATQLHARLDALDQAITIAAATIPAAHRKLVTYHDSWAYFGPRYGLDVIASVQPEGFTEPSAQEVRDVIDQIRTHGVAAVFGSEVFPSAVLKTIADETGVQFVGDLADDALPGERGSAEHSYIGMMLRNARVIVAALGGDPAALDRFGSGA